MQNLTLLQGLLSCLTEAIFITSAPCQVKNTLDLKCTFSYSGLTEEKHRCGSV